MNNSYKKRKILLIEPNYKNKFPPIGLMKIATYHRKLGDDVTFYKGDLGEFVRQEILDECIRKLTNVENKIDWREKAEELKEFIKTKHLSIYEDGQIYKSKNWPLIESNLDYYRRYFIKGLYKRDPKWDRVYITTLFTFHWKKTIETINFAKIFVKDLKELKVGGIMASLIPDEIEKATGIKPFQGLLDKPYQLDKFSGMVVDKQPLDYSILDEIDYEYPLRNAYFTYMTKGCKNKCRFCAVPKLEPSFNPKIPTIRKFNYIKRLYGDQKLLLLMDNNVLASPKFDEIIDEIKRMGFYKKATFKEPNQLEISIRNLEMGINDKAYIKQSFKLIHGLLKKLHGKVAQEYYNILDEYNLLKVNTTTKDNLIEAYSKIGRYYKVYRGKKTGLRYVDFNQGVDCRRVTPRKMKLISEIPINPLRIAFDDLKYKDKYIKAVELAAKYDIKEFSNYLLYNYHDHPDDLYKRLEINIELCERLDVTIYSFPMKYIPVKGEYSKNRDYTGPYWNKKFIGAIQAILNVTKGIVAPPSRNGSGRSFFEKAFGKNLKEYHEILFMPETYIVYRKLFEKDLNLTGKWQKAFKALNQNEFKKIRPIIESNKLANYNGHFKSKKIKEVLKHYRIKRDDVKLITKEYGTIKFNIDDFIRDHKNTNLSVS